MVQYIRELAPSSRPRERLLDFGPSVLSDAELLAVLMRTGRRGRGAVGEANALLVAAGGLPGLARWSAAELLGVDGIGPAKAATILASLELGHRVARSRLREAEVLGTKIGSFDNPDAMSADEFNRLIVRVLNFIERLLPIVQTSDLTLTL